MPLYEYGCEACGHRQTILARSFASTPPSNCVACSGTSMQRLVSRPVILRSEASRIEELTPEAERTGSYYHDDRNVGLWAKKRTRELGLSSEVTHQIDDVVERVRDGDTLSEQLD